MDNKKTLKECFTWHDYSMEDPPDSLIDKILLVKYDSVSAPGYTYEVNARWAGTCFLTQEDDGSWSGPLRVVTHWKIVSREC